MNADPAPVPKSLAARVSAIIPVYNGERYLAEAIDSVLAQADVPVELIVVDDGSSDSSLRIAEGYETRVRSLRQDHRGAAAARNLGISAARGDCFAFLDADDLWTTDKLALQLHALDADPGLDMVFGLVEPFKSPELDAATSASLFCPAGAMPGHTAVSMLIRREAFARVGPFSESWKIGEVVDWYSRALEAGLRSLMLQRVVVRRRLHSRNTGQTQRADYRDYARILKAALDRRRRAASAAQPSKEQP